LNLHLHEGELRTLSLTLKQVINIEGKLLMLDDMTPHVAVPAQVIRNGKVIATTLSDEKGKYRFINLKQGRYQVRCQVLGGYAYYENTKSGGEFLEVTSDTTLSNIDFRLAPFKKGTWRNYTYLDGLAGQVVNAIYSAPDGMMWFGTSDGVSRYDKKGFKTLTIEDGLANNLVMDIDGAPDGTMWFGTATLGFGPGGGLSRYDGKEFKNFTTKDGLARNTVGDIYCTPDGVIWSGMSAWGPAGGGVSRYDGKTFLNFVTQDGLVHNGVRAICRASDGAMLFGT